MSDGGCERCKVAALAVRGGGAVLGVEGRGGALMAGGGSVSASGVGDVRADRASPLDRKRRVRSAVFDVKRFGALADGRTDDRKVFSSSLPSSISLSL